MESVSGTPEAATEASKEIKQMPEGMHTFSNKQKEGGVALVNNANGDLEVAMTAPMEAQVKGGTKVTIGTPDGKTKDVLDIALMALSPKGTQGAALQHLQLDRDTLTNLLAVAAQQGILPKAESKWAPGGKMDQMTRLALDIDQRLSNR